MTPYSRSDLACRDLVEMVTDYLEGTLTRDRLDAVRAHLADCADCTDYVEQMRVTVGLAARLRDADLPAELQSRLRAVLRAADPGGRTHIAGHAGRSGP